MYSDGVVDASEFSDSYWGEGKKETTLGEDNQEKEPRSQETNKEFFISVFQQFSFIMLFRNAIKGRTKTLKL